MLNGDCHWINPVCVCVQKFSSDGIFFWSEISDFDEKMQEIYWNRRKI